MKFQMVIIHQPLEKEEMEIRRHNLKVLGYFWVWSKAAQNNNNTLRINVLNKVLLIKFHEKLYLIAQYRKIYSYNYSHFVTTLKGKNQS